ncbi:hypothetical protein DSS92_24265 [Salmonella enterica subsp. enterica]|nr:hypothetical protein [Salmonella enterica]EBV0858495.1 hypothetical protein [Salmonella enterica subsp. enterica serovar Anecho]ECG1298745.1 hypothetical protein [Salmonella enterica subsp. enterica]ECT9455127.1 hypothetical protein [Salmonella enterica subsp. enterica serovar Oskarshamn]EDO4265139.1 hypothetical protein [Salmonella enterica]
MNSSCSWNGSNDKKDTGWNANARKRRSACSFRSKRAPIYLAAWLCNRVKFIRRVSGGFSGGLLPVLSRCCRKRRQSRSGGADNGRYGKSGCS